jgi:methylated-DNA-[protein]-cysteine S-methyltransferase
MPTTETFTTYITSPLGTLEIVGNEIEINATNFKENVENQGTNFDNLPQLMQRCIGQLQAYFEGVLQVFDFPISQKGTDFQQKVWAELLNIPFGKTCSYLALSRKIGDEKSIRAVGTTNGKNQLAIIVPCHRVIGSNGDLTGYAGGLWRKRWLLEHEQKVAHGGLQTLF